MNKIIVTGGLGFIGSHFVNYVLENSNDEIIIVDKETYASNRNNLKRDVEIIKKDICDITADDLGDYDYIVHFAAESHVDNSIANGLPFVKTNIEGTFNMVEVARKNSKLKKFIHISTDEVYGDMDEHIAINHSATEAEPIKPSSYYSATKASSDLIVISANRTFGLPYLITRTCNNYGENQHVEKFIPKIIHSIKNGLVIPVYGDGLQSREWIHADDNVKSIYTLLISDEVNTVYNIGTGERFTNIAILELIGGFLSKTPEYKFVTDRLGHDRKYALNSLKYVNKFDEIQTINFANWLKTQI
jgi:dTDP-glucose 4,6-dehydratase